VRSRALFVSALLVVAPVFLVRAPGIAHGSARIKPPAELPAPPAPPATDETGLIQGFLPKEDLGVLDFLQKQPTADGRGIVVAILDTGVDLTHPALQKTSTGEPKILDVYDATDDGYVELPLARKTGGPDPVRGISGRILRLPVDLAVGTEVRLGILISRDIFPRGLVARRAAERRGAWERERQRWEAANAESTGDRADAVRKALDRVIEKDGDPGDRYDVVAIPRGEGRWEVRIDTNADGDLTNETPLHPYHEAREIARFPDPLNFSAALDRIAPDASSLFLYFDEGGHGTHVAGIVAGFYGADDPLNGLAPGAQLIAAKVGNGNLGGSTSHNSIMKAAQWAVDHGADVINLSFGGGTFFEDGNEEVPRFFNDLVERTGVVICASAGNAGPALSTIGEPATARRVFAWGASISKKTQQTNYGSLEPRRDELFQFSSRGPLLSGDPGVDFISPGAALSSLPTWLLVAGESWNGTSMASPQGAGFSALLLSACRQQGIPVTPDRLRRAMREGARLLPGISAIEQGDGMPQAGPTLDALRRLAVAYPAQAVAGRAPHDRGAAQPIVGYLIAVDNATGRGGGYYERGLREKDPYRVPFGVTPDFPRDSLQAARGAFLRIVHLESDAAWLQPPITQSIAADGAVIQVRIDPSKLAPGLNVGRVVARDVRRPDTGCEFTLLATVIVPEEPDPRRPILNGTWDFLPGDRRDAFVRVPQGATVARLRMQETLADPANAYEVALAAPDLVRKPGERVAGNRLVLARDQAGTIELRVLPGSVLEVVAYSRWHTNRPGRLAWRLEFDGVNASREPAPAIAFGRPGVGVVLGAPPWGATVRFEAAIDREVLPMDVKWRVRRDTLFTGPLAGIPSMVEEGDALVRAGGDHQRIEMDMRTPPELENFLDDAHWRAFDDSGRRVAAGYLGDDPVAFEAPHADVYRIRFSIYARGGEMFEAAKVVSPVLISKIDARRLTVFRSPAGGFARGGDSLDVARLLPGERRRFFLRGDGLPAGKLLRGSLKVRREGEGGSLLIDIPIEADTRDLAPPTGELIARAARDAIDRAGLLTGRSDVPAGERDAAAKELARVEALRLDDASALWNLREARARFLLRGEDRDAVGAALGSLRESLPDAKPDEPAKLAERRAKEAVANELDAEIAWRKGDAAASRKLLTAARALDPGVGGAMRLDAILDSREGKDKECRDSAQDWLRSHPDDREIDEVLVQSYVRAGWWDLAALRLASWPAAHPKDSEAAARLWADVDAARSRTALPGSPFTAFVP